MEMQFLPRSVLKISTLALAIAAASFTTSTVMAAECELNDATNTTNILDLLQKYRFIDLR